MTSAAFSIHPTPIGDALIVTTDAGLVSLEVLDGALESALAQVASVLRTVPDHDVDATHAVARQLDEYFTGARREFDLAVDWRLVTGFTRAALIAVCDIPYGETASYAEIAIAAGSPGAHRAVGSACARTPVSIVVPAHRVVRADGSIGEYGGHPERKAFLLHLEDRTRAQTTADE